MIEYNDICEGKKTTKIKINEYWTASTIEIHMSITG